MTHFLNFLFWTSSTSITSSNPLEFALIFWTSSVNEFHIPNQSLWGFSSATFGKLSKDLGVVDRLQEVEYLRRRRLLRDGMGWDGNNPNFTANFLGRFFLDEKKTSKVKGSCLFLEHKWGWGFFLESRSYRRGVDTSHVTKDCPTHVNVDERSNPCYWREQRIVDLRGLCFQTWQKAWFDHNCQPLDLFSWRYFTLCFIPW